MNLIDRTEVIRALRCFYRQGDVYEVRALDAVTGGYMRPHVESGYFNYDHIEDVPKHLANLRAYRGVYVTVNPPNSDLIARANNRIRDVRRDPITTDADVPRRRWLLIDCDAIRASGIPANNAEHIAALECARKIRAELIESGWPEPIMNDSGNGAQLMFRIDIPAEDNNLVQQVIAGLSSVYSTPAVDIDLTVHNPARIWRLPGTMNSKGDEVGDRVHRQARIIAAPAEPGIVAECQLREWAEIGRKAIEEKNGRPSSSSAAASGIDISAICGDAPAPEPPRESFDLDNWISRYAPELHNPQSWQGGRKWVFEVCPFNEAHRNRSAVLIQQQSGAVVFRCHHNGCSGNDWTAFRTLREPEYAERLANPGFRRTVAVYGGELPDSVPADTQKAPTPAMTPDEPEVASEGAETPAESKKSKSISTRHPNPGPMTDEMLRVPGFIQTVMDYDLATAPYPNRVLAFSGALTLESFLTSRKYRDSANNMTNIYLIALANSGSGKDHPRKINVEVAYAANMSAQIGDAFASGEGIEDAMMLNRVMLFQTDEIDGLFNSINKAKDGRNEMIMNVLLKLYSSSNSIYTGRVKAQGRNGYGATKKPETVCDKPGLTLFGTAIPKFLYESLNGRMLENGFFARTLIIEADSRGRGQEAEYMPPPDDVLNTAKYWASFTPFSVSTSGSGNLFDEHPEPEIIPYADGVKELYAKFRTEADDQYAIFEVQGDLTATSLWNRAFEKARKLAMLYALSENPEHPVISRTAIEWAWNFSVYQTRRQLFMAESYVADNPFHQTCLKLLRRLRESGGRMERSAMLRAMHLKVSDLEAVETYLCDAGEIEQQWETGRNGKAKSFYAIVE